MNRLYLDIQKFGADGKVVIETLLDKAGFENGLNKIQSIAKAGFKGVATSVGVVSTAMTALVGKSVQAAGELEQQIGGAEAVFKSLGDTIEDIKFTSFQDAEGNVMSLKQVSNEAYKTMGLSANDYLATINKMGALMQGSGLDTQKAMDLSGQAMQRAADVASIMGIDVNSAMESIAGAAKGNFTMMDNLGVAMNATTIEAYALSKGIKTSYNEMTNAQKVELAMEMFLEKSAYATGNYVKENQTFAGSFTTLKASIQNFLSGAGDIESVIDSVMDFGEILIKSIGEMAPKMVDGIIKLINGIIPQLPALLEKLLPTVIQGAINLINGLVSALPTLIPVLMNGIVQAFTGIVQILPELLKALIQATIFIVNALAEQLPTLIPQIIDAILEMIPILIDNLPLFIKAGWQLIIGLAQGILNSIPTLLSHLPKIGKAILNYLKQLPGMVVDIGKNIVKGIWSGLSNSLQWIKNKISGWVGNVMKFIKKLFGIHSPSTLMRDEVGVYLAQGLGVGFDDELDSVYRDMQKSINFENAKIQANVESGKIFNSLVNSTPISISLDGSVEMDNQKVGRIITPVVARTIKTGGGN
jgi:phage-related protein